MFCESCGAMGEEGDLVCLTCGREHSSLPKAAALKPADPAAPDSNVWLPEPVAPAAAPAEPALALEHPCPVHPELPVGGTCPRCGKFVCIICAPKLTEGNAHCSDCLARIAPTEEEGIGGWLILSAIGLVLNPIAAVILAGLYVTRGEFFLGVLHLSVAVLGGYVAILFFGRKKTAPPMMILLMIALALANLASGTLNASFGWSVLWIIYFVTSKRVKRTFVK